MTNYSTFLTYSLEVLNPAPWVAIQSTDVGVNEYCLSAVFVDASGTAETALGDEVTHALRDTTDIYEDLKVCTATGRYSGGETDESGYNVPWDEGIDDDTRNLWLKFRPPTSSTVQSQKLIVGVIAGKYVP